MRYPTDGLGNPCTAKTVPQQAAFRPGHPLWAATAALYPAAAWKMQPEGPRKVAVCFPRFDRRVPQADGESRVDYAGA